MLDYFQWCYDSPLGETIRESTWLFPVIEAFHLLGLALTVGSVLIVDLRLLGAGLKKESVVQLSAGAQPWLIAGIILMFVSGIPLFFAESIKCYYSFPFWVKMTSLLLLIVFIFSVRRRVTQTDVAADRPLSGPVTATISLLLLFAVAWGGRWIGFS